MNAVVLREFAVIAGPRQTDYRLHREALAHLARKQKHMRLRSITIRLAALIVLLTSFSDYWAYDRWDPTAPMNSSGPEAIASLAMHRGSDVVLASASLQDDHCLCCSPVIAPSGPVLPPPSMGLPVDRLVYSIRSAALSAFVSGATLPLVDPPHFGRPLRV